MATPPVPSPSPGKQGRVIMLCPPRATSTVFTRCISGVPNSDIFFDTHFFCYEAEYNLRLMGKEVADDLPDEDWREAAEMTAGEDCSGNKLDIDLLKYSKLKKALDNPNSNKTFIFYKLTSQALDKDHFRFLPDKSSNYRYSFLIRHPIKVFMSWRRATFSIISNISTSAMKEKKSEEEFHFMRDVPEKYIFQGRFFKDLYDQWLYVRENLDPNPVIIDSDDLLADPKGILSKYCEALEIPYSDDLLKWEGDPAATDTWKIAFRPMRIFRFAHIMCSNAFHSTGFKPPSMLPSINDVTDDVRESVEFVQPYWEEMYAARIKP